MKFQPIFNFWAIALLSLLFVTACDDSDDPEPDNTVPEITVAQPTEGGEYQAGGAIDIQATITDDIEVSEIQITLHDVFDGHSHTDKTNATSWAWSEVFTANAATYQLAETVDIPMEAASGPYHIVIDALDASGNSAQLVEVNFEIVNNSQPTINSLTVNGDAVIGEIHEHFDGGATSADYTVAFSANDPDGLDEVHLELKAHHDHDHDGHDHSDKTNHGDEEAYWEKEIPGNGQTELAVEETITFEKDKMEDGDYELRIKVKDNDGNVKVEEVKFHVGDH